MLIATKCPSRPSPWKSRTADAPGSSGAVLRLRLRSLGGRGVRGSQLAMVPLDAAYGSTCTRRMARTTVALAIVLASAYWSPM